MKAKLVFELPEDQSEFELTCEAGAWHSVVWEMDNYLRNKIKHEEFPEPAYYAAYEDARDHLRQAMEDYNLTFD